MLKVSPRVGVEVDDGVGVGVEVVSKAMTGGFAFAKGNAGAATWVMVVVFAFNGFSFWLSEIDDNFLFSCTWFEVWTSFELVYAIMLWEVLEWEFNVTIPDEFDWATIFLFEELWGIFWVITYEPTVLWGILWEWTDKELLASGLFAAGFEWSIEDAPVL